MTINLLADGEKVDMVQLSATNNWQHTFEALQKYKNGVEIKYTISEDDVEGYTSKISGDAESGYTVTNTKKETQETDPKKPTTPTVRSSNSPKTGDNSNIALWAVIMLISGGLLLFLFYRRRRRSGTQ